MTELVERAEANGLEAVLWHEEGVMLGIYHPDSSSQEWIAKFRFAEVIEAECRSIVENGDMDFGHEFHSALLIAAEKIKAATMIAEADGCPPYPSIPPEKGASSPPPAPSPEAPQET